MRTYWGKKQTKRFVFNRLALNPMFCLSSNMLNLDLHSHFLLEWNEEPCAEDYNCVKVCTLKSWANGQELCNAQTIQKLLALGDEKISPFTIPSLAVHSSSFLVLFTLAYGIATPGGIFMPSIMVSAFFFSFFFETPVLHVMLRLKRKLRSFWHMLPWNNTDLLKILMQSMSRFLQCNKENICFWKWSWTTIICRWN